VNRPQQPFVLDGDVVPVIIADSGVAFTAAPTPPYGVTDIFTIGPQVAPAINTIMADTGPLPVGAYSVKVISFWGERNEMAFEWRDAANAANLWLELIGASVEERMAIWESTFLVENPNERFRMRMNSAGSAGITFQASILARI